MRKLFVAFLAAVFVLGSSYAPATRAQSGLQQIDAFMRGRVVAEVYAAEDTLVGMYVRYIGTAADAQIQVIVTTGDIVFTEHNGTALAADASILDPGGTPGTIDVSDTLANTLGLVVDIINLDPNWVAAIHAGLRTDASTAGVFVTLAATSNVMRPEGQGLAYDTDGGARGYGTFGGVLSQNVDGRDYFTMNGGLIPNPFKGKKAGLFWLRYNCTENGGMVFNIYSVRVNNKATGSEAVTNLYQYTLTSGSQTILASFEDIGLFARPDEKLLMLVTETNTIGAFLLFNAAGYEYER